MNLRPYQQDAVAGVVSCLRDNKSTLVVLPTGTGKTVVFCELARIAKGRVLVIANRRTLVEQTAEKLKLWTGKEPALEMGEHRNREDHGFFAKPKFVVSTVQSMSKRFAKYRPDEFSLIIIDEAHHAPAETYGVCLEHFAAAKLVGVTATPDRGDKIALGERFASTAIDMTLLDAIDQGWLVPWQVFPVEVSSADLSNAKVGKGKWDERKVAAILEEEGALHEIARPILGEQGDRPTIVFAASIDQATRLAEIMNRPENKPGSAAVIHSKQDERINRHIIEQMRGSRIQTLVNVDMAIEGFDVPEIACVAIARPVGVRSRFAQMVGRGTRPLGGVVDGPETPEARRAAIAASKKSDLLIIDFEDNSQDHDLVHPADVLGGEPMSDAMRAKIREVQKQTAERDIRKLKEIASRKLEEEEEEKRRSEERQYVVFTPEYRRKALEPMRILGAKANHNIDLSNSKPLSAGQIAMLKRQGVEVNALNMSELRAIHGQIINRMKRKLCTLKQARILERHGYSTDMSFTKANEVLTRIFSKQRA